MTVRILHIKIYRYGLDQSNILSVPPSVSFHEKEAARRPLAHAQLCPGGAWSDLASRHSWKISKL